MDKRDPGVAAIKEWIDNEYATGRTTVIGDAEMEQQVKSISPSAHPAGEPFRNNPLNGNCRKGIAPLPATSMIEKRRRKASVEGHRAALGHMTVYANATGIPEPPRLLAARRATSKERQAGPWKRLPSPDGKRRSDPLTAYLQMESPLPGSLYHPPAVIICPGGAYKELCDREGEPVALSFLAKGYHAFVLKILHRRRKNLRRRPADGETALRLIRERAAEWRVQPDHIAVCGSSAGGHLAGALGVMGRERPNALILCYACILDNLSRLFPFPVPLWMKGWTLKRLRPFVPHPGRRHRSAGKSAAVQRRFRPGRDSL